MHSQFTPIHHSARGDAEGSTIKLSHFPFNLGNEEHAWENDFVLFHRPQPFATPKWKDVYHEERKDAHRSGWKLLPWHCRGPESGWLGLNFYRLVPALPEVARVSSQGWLFERDLQKMTLASNMDLENLKNMNMKIERWKKPIPRSRFVYEVKLSWGEDWDFFMSFNALFSVLLKEYSFWKLFSLFTSLITIDLVLCAWESFQVKGFNWFCWWKGISKEDVAAVFPLDAQSLHSVRLETSRSLFTGDSDWGTSNLKAVKYAFSYA